MVFQDQDGWVTVTGPVSDKGKENQDQHLKAETTIIITYICGFIGMLTINISVVSNRDLKFKTPELYPKRHRGLSCGKARATWCWCLVVCVRIWFCPIKTKMWITTDDFMLSKEWKRSKSGLPAFKRDKVVLLSFFLLNFFAFLQKQLKIWEARWWNMWALAVCKVCRNSVKVYIIV